MIRPLAPLGECVKDPLKHAGNESEGTRGARWQTAVAQILTLTTRQAKVLQGSANSDRMLIS